MKTGVLLINLGTPDSPSTGDVRKYLTQFLNDKRVIDINLAGRVALVNGVIVPFRSPKSAKLYRSIWGKEGSPLLFHSLNLKKLLQEELGNNYIVSLGMRYQKPSIKLALDELRKQMVEKIIVLPLYPQYASSSTGSTIEEVFRIIKRWEVIPTLKVISKFYDREGFINAFVDVASKYNVNDYDHVLFSYHGLPERHILKGAKHYGDNCCNLGSCCDVITSKNAYCYRAAAFETTRQLVKKLNIPEGKYSTSFQSRLNDKWIKPYSDKVVEEKAKEGIRRMLVFSPAFVADCLETIHEIGVEYDEIFKASGGEHLQMVESLNTNSVWVNELKQMVKENS